MSGRGDRRTLRWSVVPTALGSGQENQRSNDARRNRLVLRAVWCPLRLHSEPAQRPLTQGSARPGQGPEELRSHRRPVHGRRPDPGPRRGRPPDSTSSDRGLPPHLQLLHDLPAVRMRSLLEPEGRSLSVLRATVRHAGQSRPKTTSSCGRPSLDGTPTGRCSPKVPMSSPLPVPLRRRPSTSPSTSPNPSRSSRPGRRAAPSWPAADLPAVAQTPATGPDGRKAHRSHQKPADPEAASLWPIADEIAPEMTLTPEELDLVESKLGQAEASPGHAPEGRTVPEPHLFSPEHASLQMTPPRTLPDRPNGRQAMPPVPLHSLRHGSRRQPRPRRRPVAIAADRPAVGALRD